MIEKLKKIEKSIDKMKDSKIKEAIKRDLAIKKNKTVLKHA